jgi:hypothetical protein
MQLKHACEIFGRNLFDASKAMACCFAKHIASCCTGTGAAICTAVVVASYNGR